MQSTRWQTLKRRLGSLRKPGLSALAFVGVALSCLLLPQWWALSRNEDQRRQELRVALRTTADTTEIAIREWEGEALRRARALLVSRESAEAFQRALDGGARIVEAGEALGGRLQAEGFKDLALLDAQGKVLAATVADWLERSLSPEQIEEITGSGGRFVPWDERSGWSPALVVPAPGGAFPGGFLALSVDPVAELAGLVRERALGRSGRTSLFAVGGPWIVDSNGVSLEVCARSPEAVLAEAAGGRGQAAGGAPSFNLDGYRDCHGNEVVGVWSQSGNAGLGLITEISYGEAYSSLTTARVTFVGFGVMLAGLLLMLVLVQTSGDPSPATEPAKRQRNSAAWGILGVALLATVIAWVTARSRYLEHQRDRFSTSAQRGSRPAGPAGEKCRGAQRRARRVACVSVDGSRRLAAVSGRAEPARRVPGDLVRDGRVAGPSGAGAAVLLSGLGAGGRLCGVRVPAHGRAAA